MRGANKLLMFGLVARTIRINAFSIPTSPGSKPKVAMSSASVLLFDRVAGDGVGGAGTTLIPKVRLWKA